MTALQQMQERLRAVPAVQAHGVVTGLRGTMVTARIPSAARGDLVSICCRGGREVAAEVIGFDTDQVTLALLAHADGITPGARVSTSGRQPSLSFDPQARGVILDAMGEPHPGQTLPQTSGPKVVVPLRSPPPNPLTRKPICTPLLTGITSIDLCLTLGRGQRIGVFANAGVGKSTLLGMLARNAEVDLLVVGLVGERGREVVEFVQDTLGSSLSRTIVVAATSDESSMRRLSAAHTATAIAEYYRSRGLHVLLLIDSLTRTARALREVGLSAGELPVRQGYTPSVFTELPRLLERPGETHEGSVTALYTLLSTAEHEVDPLAEEVKSILDGHLILSQSVAVAGVRPAIDLPASISRVRDQVLRPAGDQEWARLGACAINVIARARKIRELLLLGGSADARAQELLAVDDRLTELMNQRPNERAILTEKLAALAEILRRTAH